MKVCIAIDSFKGSLTTFEAGESAKEGILRACPDAVVDVRPMADGGEGTMEALTRALGGETAEVQVRGPLGSPVTARYGISGTTALMEMAQASGITLVSRDELDPMAATTYGVGQMIVDAINRGCRSFVMGIGGSATNDGGMGMLQALGVNFRDGLGNPLPCRGDSLGKVKSIDISGVLPQLRECEFSIACDVKNPLCGDNGCSAIFGPQKGLGAEQVPLMDGWLGEYSKLVQSILPHADPCAPGAGAAGGLGFALMAFCRAQLRSGIDLVMDATALEEHIKAADLVITGEGKLDKQSCMGKAPSGVAQLSKKHGKLCIALCGAAGEGAGSCNERGIDAYFPILRTPCSLDDAMDKKTAKANMAAAAEQIMRLVLAVKS